MVKLGTDTSWQYILEDSTETPTTSVQFRIPGVVVSAPTDSKFNAKEYRGLKQPTDTDKRRVDLIVPSKNEYPFTVTYIPLKRSSAPKYDFRHFHNLVMNNSSSTAVGGAWTYGTSLTTALRTLTLFKETDTIQYRLSGGKVSRLTARCSLDNPLEITVEGMGSLATYADLARTDASTLRDGTPFMWSDISVYLDSALATFCTAFEYTVNNNAESDHSLGDRDPKGIALKGRTIELSVTRQFNDTGEFASAKNGTAKRVTIRLDDATDADIVFRDAKYDGIPNPGENEGILTHILRLKVEEMSTN